MARAKMSGQADRAFLRHPAVQPTEASWAGMALAEAQAILAETERVPHGPDCLCVGHAVLRPIPNVPFIGEDHSYRALAESLALFLGQTFSGEECRCVQGHHWSPERGSFDCGGIVS